MRKAQDNPASITQGLESAAFAVPQKGLIDMAHALENPSEDIVIVEKLPSTEYAEELKFAEEPVTCILNASSDVKAPKYVYCCIEGVGAEVWDEKSKRWLRFKYVPVNRRLTIKRKYLEVLARSRVDSYSTREVSPTPLANHDGYALEGTTVQASPFIVTHDPSGERGHQWLQRVLSEY